MKKKPGKKLEPIAPHVKHGAASGTFRKRFDDKRSTQGRALSEAVDALVEHFGGPTNITAPMQLLIDSGIRPKLITLILISSPVNGLRPLRAFLFTTLKVPNPTRLTSSPFFSDLVMD
jgi:hypothetical protein